MLPCGVEQHALDDVAEGHAQQQGDAQRRSEEDQSQAVRQRGDGRLLRNSMATVRRISTSSTSIIAR